MFSSWANNLKKANWRLLAWLPLWVVLGYAASQLAVVGVVLALKALGFSFAGINVAVLNTVVAACVYLLSLIFVVGIPWIVKKRTTTKAELGLTRLPSWLDIGLAPVSFIIYLIASGVILLVVRQLFPLFDSLQAQEVGFANLSSRYEYILAFITLVVIAPLAEEVLFRGYLYGKLRKSGPVWLAILITSILFGAVHGQWNVGIDVFVLSIMLCALREITGSIWAGVLLHMMKNGVAFYLLFINPSLLRIIGG